LKAWARRRGRRESLRLLASKPAGHEGARALPSKSLHWPSGREQIPRKEANPAVHADLLSRLQTEL
jgi:hypothetical protein